MAVEAGQGIELSCRRAAAWCGFGVAAVAFCVLIASLLGLPEIASLRNAWPAMSVNTAVLLLLASFSLYRRASEAWERPDRFTAFLAISVIAGVAVTFVQYYYVGLIPAHGRMSPASGVVLTALATALLLMNVSPVASRSLAVLTGILSLLPITAWLYGWRPIEHPRWYRDMAVPTALSALALAIGLFCARPESGLMRVLTGGTAASRTIRRLAVASVAVPIGSGWLFHAAAAASPDRDTWTLTLYSITTVILLGAITATAGLFLTRAEAERDAAGAALAEREQRFRMTFEQAAVGIAHVAPDGRWLRVNRKLCQIVGYTQEELLGKTFQDITHPADLDADMAHVRQVLAGEIETYTMEKRYVRKDGSIVWIDLTVSLVRDSDGSPKYFISVIEDIGERKRATELMRKYARELERSNTELEDFAFIASHDLQEPLRKIVAFGRRLEEASAGSLNPESRESLERIIGAAARMSRLIEGVLDLSRVTTAAGAFESVSLAVPVMEAVQDLEARIQATGAEIEVGDLPVIEADRLQMKRLFANLLVNALKFTAVGRAPRIRIVSNGCAEAESFRITVADNGIGFEEKHAEKIFAPFQRLHGPLRYEGSGMGLAICRKIAARHSGSIVAMSRPGEGATFVITLPARQAETERRR